MDDMEATYGVRSMLADPFIAVLPPLAQPQYQAGLWEERFQIHSALDDIH